MTVTADGESPPIFAESAVSKLPVNVADYVALLELMRHKYYGRLKDLLDVKKN